MVLENLHTTEKLLILIKKAQFLKSYIEFSILLKLLLY